MATARSDTTGGEVGVIGPDAERVVVRESGRSELGGPRGVMLALLGAAFLLVGLVDLTLLWTPLQLDSVTWEFATIGRTLDGLPMSALGLGLLIYGTTRGPRVRRSRLKVYGFAFGLLAALLALLAVLYFTAMPTVLQQAELEVGEGLRRSAIRHGAQSVIYPLAFGLIAAVLWRAGRSPS